MLSADFIKSLDQTISDQETTIRVLEQCLAELKENVDDGAEHRPRKEKKTKKRKLQKVSRPTQCRLVQKKGSSSQTELPRLGRISAVSVEILPTKKDTQTTQTDPSTGLDLDLEAMITKPSAFSQAYSSRLPALAAIGEKVKQKDMDQSSSIMPAFDESISNIWKNAALKDETDPKQKSVSFRPRPVFISKDLLLESTEEVKLESPESDSESTESSSTPDWPNYGLSTPDSPELDSELTESKSSGSEQIFKDLDSAPQQKTKVARAIVEPIRLESRRFEANGAESDEPDSKRKSQSKPIESEPSPKESSWNKPVEGTLKAPLDQLNSIDFPSLSSGNGAAKLEGNRDISFLSEMRLTARAPAPRVPSSYSVSSRSTSPTASSQASEAHSHRKNRLVITNYTIDQSPTERKKYAQQLFKPLGVKPSKVVDVEVVNLNKANGLKITFDSIETATFIMERIRDQSGHPYLPFPTPESRVYYDLTSEELYRVSELKCEANARNSTLGPTEPKYFVCSFDMALKRRAELKVPEVFDSTRSKSRQIDCFSEGSSPNALFHTFEKIVETPMAGRTEIGLGRLISLLKKLDSKRLEAIRSRPSFVAEVRTLVEIGLCATNPRHSFSYLVTKRKGIVFFFDEKSEMTPTKGNTKNKFALLEDEDEEEEEVEENAMAKMIVLSETLSGDYDEQKTVLLASSLLKTSNDYQLLKPDYSSYNELSWWLEARLSSRVASIFMEDSATTKEMGGGNSAGARCLLLVNKVLSEIHDAIGTSEELHFRLEKKAADRAIRLGVTDNHAPFSVLLRAF